ncbi:MAG TPA: hypothetical protein VFP35_00555 [Candidatus Saccharimonadales bacterium]|nr:hypothetical protein [Candidatus Saccharimonadales bacterium]
MGESYDHLPENVAKAYPDFAHMTKVYTEELETALDEMGSPANPTGGSVINAVKRARERLDNERFEAQDGGQPGDAFDV